MRVMGMGRSCMILHSERSTLPVLPLVLGPVSWNVLLGHKTLFGTVWQRACQDVGCARTFWKVPETK